MTTSNVDRVFLVGISGAGKSSVAAVLAKRLGWKAQDSDAEVERRTARTIPWLFTHKGEAVFRGFEQSAVLEMAARPRQVMALGGGAFVNPLTRAALLRRGLVVWLDVDPDEAARRLAPDLAAEPRPMLGETTPSAACEPSGPNGPPPTSKPTSTSTPPPSPSTPSPTKSSTSRSGGRS